MTNSPQSSSCRTSNSGRTATPRPATVLPCFARQHQLPTLADYHTLLGESAEMAWIATEGNTFNHITERVYDIDLVALWGLEFVVESRLHGDPVELALDDTVFGGTFGEFQRRVGQVLEIQIHIERVRQPILGTQVH